MAVNVSVRGLRRAVARIKALPLRLNRVRNAALDDWATELEKTARDLAPVRRGVLRGDIKARINHTAGKAWVGVYGEASKYGYYVEKGTSKMDDQPFLGPAAQIHRRTGERAVREAASRFLGG
ncbi:HK97-gp10 family putative phage morphogenesis protein [Streptomyces sp. NPDC058644]|uniref:HK97-gp10 family putative phage morphogenesis protein n=1 Tax=unclassified Streptomyces TaxID=2593676 RepID=UPI003662006B